MRVKKNALNFIAKLLPDKWHKMLHEWWWCSERGAYLPGNSAISSGWLHKFKDLIWRRTKGNSPMPRSPPPSPPSSIPISLPRPLQIDDNDDDDEMFAQPLMDLSRWKGAGPGWLIGPSRWDNSLMGMFVCAKRNAVRTKIT